MKQEFLQICFEKYAKYILEIVEHHISKRGNKLKNLLKISIFFNAINFFNMTIWRNNEIVVFPT